MRDVMMTREEYNERLEALAERFERIATKLGAPEPRPDLHLVRDSNSQSKDGDDG